MKDSFASQDYLDVFDSRCLDISSFDKELRKSFHRLNSDEYNRIIQELIYENHAGYILMMMGAALQKARILYVGRIEGGIPFCLGLHGHTVFVCDIEKDKLNFISKRSKALGLNNIYCLNSRLDSLPFKKHVFDLIVLETKSFYPENHGAEQPNLDLGRILQRIKGFQKENGQFIVLTGNRLSPTRVFKAFRNGLKELKNTHSFFVYRIRRILKDMGFRQVHSYGIYPDAGYFQPLVKIKHGLGATFQFFGSGDVTKRSLKSRFKSALTRNKLFAPSYGVSASVERSPIFIEEILDIVCGELKNNPNINIKKPVVQSIINRKTQRIMVRISEKNCPKLSVLLKIPFGKWAKIRELNNYSAIEEVNSREGISEYIKKRVPRPIYQGLIYDREVYIESFFSYCFPSHRRDAYTLHYEAMKFIFLLHSRTISNETLAGAVYKRLVDDPLDSIETFCYQDGHFRCLDVLRRYVKGVLLGRDIPLVFVHGDFGFGNILVGKNIKALSGVIDWELSDPKGLPGQDLFFLLLDFDRNGLDGYIEFLRMYITNPEEASRKNMYIKKYLDLLKLPADVLPALIILHWACQVASRGFSMRKTYHPYWLENNIYNFLYRCSRVLECGV